MRAEEILARLDEIRTLVECHTAPDGTIEIDSASVHIATEFCLTEIQRALDRAHNKDSGID